MVFWGERRLSESIYIDGALTRPAWQQLASYVEIDKKYKKRNAAPFGEKEISFDRLEKSFALAEDNGDILYIDMVDGKSIWIYMHASGEVKYISPSFDEWLKNAKIED